MDFLKQYISEMYYRNKNQSFKTFIIFIFFPSSHSGSVKEKYFASVLILFSVPAFVPWEISFFIFSSDPVLKALIFFKYHQKTYY